MVRTDARAKWASCPECKADIQREKDRKRYAQQLANGDKTLPVVIERDPLPPEEGGFQKGAQFTRQDYELMMAHHHLTPGTVLRINDRRVRVDQSGTFVIAIGG